MAGLIDPYKFDYPFFVVLVFVGPLQGFNNALVYACPRFLMKDKRLLRVRATIIENTTALRGAVRRFSRWTDHESTTETDAPFEEIRAPDEACPNNNRKVGGLDPSVAIAAEIVRMLTKEGEGDSDDGVESQKSADKSESV